MGRAAAAVHDEQALGRKAAALHQLCHARFKGFIGQGLELVEQRGDEAGENPHQQQLKARPDAPGPQPPQAASGCHEPQNHPCNRQADHSGQQAGLEQVAQPDAARALVKAKARFQHKGLVVGERQVQQAGNQCKAAQQHQLLEHAGFHGLEQQFVEQVEAAQQRPAQQDQCAPGHVGQAEPCLGQGVVCSFLMGLQGNKGSENGRNSMAVLCHMAHLAGIEPDLHQQLQHQGRREGQSQ